MIKKSLLILFCLLLVSSIVSAQRVPENNTFKVDLVERVERVDYVERVASVDKITNQDSMQVFGTEYQIGDRAKAFVQLLSNSGENYITNASCFLDVHYPDGSLWYNGVLMDYVNDGMYFYDVDLPLNATEGVYMLSADCITPSIINDIHFDDFECNGFGCNSADWSGDWVINGASCNVINFDIPLDSYHFSFDDVAGSPDCDAYRSVDLSGSYDSVFLTFYAKADSLEFSDSCSYEYYNGSSYTNLLTLVNGDDDDFYQFFSFDVASYGLSNDSRVRVLADVSDSTNDGCFIDDVSFQVVQNVNESNYQYLRGSGEFHISNYVSELKNLLSNISVDINPNVTIDLSVESLQNISFLIDDLENTILDKFEFSMNAFGTYYEVADNGKVFIQLVRNDTGFNDAVCTLDIYYPSSDFGNKTYFVQGELMSSLGENGFYFFDFITPDVEGIYMTSANCFVGQNTTLLVPDSDVLIEGSVVSGSLSDTFVDDGSYYVIDEQNNGGANRSYVHDFYYNISSLPLNVTFTAIFFDGRLNPDSDDETIQVKLFNYSNSEFVTFPNEIESQDSMVDLLVSQTGDGAGISDFQNASGFLRMRFQDTLQSVDTQTNTIYIDRLGAGATFVVATPVISIQGGAELNVRSRTNDIFDLLNSTIFERFDFVSNLLYSINTNLTYEINENEAYILSINSSINNNIDAIPFIDYSQNFSDLFIAIDDIPFVNYTGSLDNILSEIQSLPDYNSNFTDLFVDINDLNTLISNINSSINNNIAGVSTQVSNVQSDIDGLEVDVSNLDGDISSLDSDVSILSNDLVIHDTDIKNRINDLELKINLILQNMNIVTEPINLEFTDETTLNCLEGSNWVMDITTTDNFANYLNDDDVSCNVTTNIWGVNSMVWDGDSFKYTNVCAGNSTITWVVECEEV